jgi:hypothetical protein
MKIMGFNFDKISVEKLSNKPENLKINTQIEVLDIESVESDLFKLREELLGVKFSFKIVYEPGFANLEIGGSLLLAVESKISKDVLKQWKDKKIPEEFNLTLFNIIVKKSSLKALQLEEDMSLPLHIPMPSFKKQEK